MVTDRPPPPSPVPPDTRSMLALYRARAAHYDEELAPFEPLRQDAIARLNLQAGQTVLDVGCGTGLSFAPLLQWLGQSGRIVGIEQSPEMMTKAQERVTTGAWAQQIHLVLAPAEVAHWQGLADAALFHFTHDILRRPAALDNVLKHLKPGAHVVATGLQWAAPWAWPVNLFVMGAAAYSVGALDGLAQPWSELATRLQGFEVHPTWMGSIFMATGTWLAKASA